MSWYRLAPRPDRRPCRAEIGPCSPSTAPDRRASSSVLARQQSGPVPRGGYAVARLDAVRPQASVIVLTCWFPSVAGVRLSPPGQPTPGRDSRRRALVRQQRRNSLLCRDELVENLPPIGVGLVETATQIDP